MVCKHLQKNCVEPITLTGHTISMSSAANTHGYELEKKKEQWAFCCKDNTPNSWSSGNALRNMAMKGRKVKEPFAWLWRCAFDATHGRLSAKKPFLTTTCDMKLPAKQPIKVTCDEAAAATA